MVRENKATTIMVTHNLRYAVEYGDRLLLMHGGSTIPDKSGEEKKIGAWKKSCRFSTGSALNVEINNS